MPCPASDTPAVSYCSDAGAPDSQLTDAPCHMDEQRSTMWQNSHPRHPRCAAPTPERTLPHTRMIHPEHSQLRHHASTRAAPAFRSYRKSFESFHRSCASRTCLGASCFESTNQPQQIHRRHAGWLCLHHHGTVLPLETQRKRACAAHRRMIAR